jgi:hypothetical protein
MEFVIGYYVIQVTIIFICILLGYFIYDKRFNRNHGEKVPDGFQEINIDPVTAIHCCESLIHGWLTHALVEQYNRLNSRFFFIVLNGRFVEEGI